MSTDDLAYLTDCGAVAVTLEAIGAAEATMALTTEYAKTRIQFDNPIGKYQGVKHRLADMFIDIESFKSLAYYAAWAVDDAPQELSRAASLAKAYAADAFGADRHRRRRPARRHRLHRGVRRPALSQAFEMGAFRVRRRRLPLPARRRTRGVVMDFDFTPEEQAFRAEVRDFLAENLPPPAERGRGFMADWLHKVRDKRWVGFSWPEEYGGGAGSLTEQAILKEEMALARAPALGTSFMGLAWVGPGTHPVRHR